MSTDISPMESTGRDTMRESLGLQLTESRITFREEEDEEVDFEEQMDVGISSSSGEYLSFF